MNKSEKIQIRVRKELKIEMIEEADSFNLTLTDFIELMFKAHKKKALKIITIKKEI